MAVLKEIAISSIQPNLVALRDVDRENAQYLELRDSIDGIGLMEPIQVAEGKADENGNIYYTLINGLQRFSCHQDLGIETIPCHVLDWDENQMQIGQLAANLKRVDTKPSDVTRALMRILNSSPTMTIPRMAKELHMSPTDINQRLNFKRLNPEIMERVDAGAIPVMSAVALSKLDPEDQVEFMAMAETLSYEEFTAIATERIHEVTKAKREGRDKASPTFVPVPRARSLKVLKEEYEAKFPMIRELVKDISNPVEAAIRVLEWTICLDPDSVAVAQEKWNQQQAEKERARIERANIAAKKKQEAAAKAQAKAQELLAEMEA